MRKHVTANVSWVGYVDWELESFHWPDSMATYLTGDNVLFSMDAFGQHISVEELFADKADRCDIWHEAEKYYANILNPFSAMVGPKLREIVGLDLPIDMIAPAHGGIWRGDDVVKVLGKYAEWADAYQEDQVTIAYDTMWNGTERIAHAIAGEIHRQSPDTVVKVFNIARSDKNEVMLKVFKSKALCVGSPTAVNDMLSSVAGWMAFLRSLKFKGKRAAAFGCYGWSGEAVKKIQDGLAAAGFDVAEQSVRSLWNPDEDDLAKVPALVEALLA